MPFDYALLRDDTVERLIREFGTTGQLSVPQGSSGGEPWESELNEDPVLHDIQVVQTQFKKEHNNGTLIEKNDVLFLVSTEGITVDPALANVIIVDGIKRQVVRIDPLRPGPVTMLWKAHARK